MSIERANSLLAVIYAAADWVAGVVRGAVPDSGKIAPAMAAVGDWLPVTARGVGW
jgi:hypothetical protein